MFKTKNPPTHLQKYIDCFWYIDGEDLPNKPDTHHSIATSKMELLFFSGGIYVKRQDCQKNRKSFGASLYGHTTEYDYHFATSRKISVFGIKFFPNAMLGLFKIPASEVTGQIVDIELILGKVGIELAEKVLEANTFHQKINIVTEFFSKRLVPINSKYTSAENGLVKIQFAKTEISIPGLIPESCISQRQFERNFKEIAGFSVKEYLKLVRFEKFIEAVLSTQKSVNKRLTELALDLGYYDQAHLNHHFKDFTGMNPKEYFSSIMSYEY